MRYAGFCGPSSQSQSLVANTERTVNFRFQRMDSRNAPTDGALYPMPGRRALSSVADIGGRAAFNAAGRAFHVLGGGVYESFAVAAPTKIGTVAQDNYPAQMAYNSASGGQLCIASGTNLYHYNLTTGVFQQVLTGECTMIGAVDGRFLAFNIVTGQVRLSASNDGTTWTAQFFARSAAPDRWQAMVIVGREIWMIGEATGEVWYNSGASPQPFALNPSSSFEEGTCAPFSAIKIGDSALWVTGTKDGIGRIVRARGYAPQAISNDAVDTALAGYARDGTLADADALSFEMEGHTFGVFSFPKFGTWAVDMETGSWCELGAWDSAMNTYKVWAPRVHCYAFNKHLIGDRTTGIISELDTTIGDDLGAPIRRMRIGPPLWCTSRERMVLSRFDLMVENGLGLSTGQGSDPTVMLRTSTDAKTWGPQRTASAGRMGEYGKRCYFMQLGSSEKLWVPEVTVSDAIPWRLLGADIDGSGFGLQVAA